MTTSTKGIPEGAPVVIPRLFCRDPAAEIEFCTTVFDAAVVNRRAGPDAALAHAMVAIGPSMVMIEAEWPMLASRAPAMDGSSPVVIYLYVANADRTIERAVAAGAKVLIEPKDQIWGDRTGWIMDPAGHVWTVASRVEETTEPEREARFSRVSSDGSAAGEGA
jgi:PhnB protein